MITLAATNRLCTLGKHTTFAISLDSLFPKYFGAYGWSKSLLQTNARAFYHPLESHFQIILVTTPWVFAPEYVLRCFTSSGTQAPSCIWFKCTIYLNCRLAGCGLSFAGLPYSQLISLSGSISKVFCYLYAPAAPPGPTLRPCLKTAHHCTLDPPPFLYCLYITLRLFDIFIISHNYILSI